MVRKERSREFKEFDARMRKLRAEAGLPDDQHQEPPRGRASIGGAGVQVGIELVAGVIGGGLIGYALDRWLDTWPVFFLLMFFLGAAGGMLNAYRYIRRWSQMPDDAGKDG